MGNKNSHPEDLPLYTDEEKNKFVEEYMASTQNPRIVRYKDNPLPVNDPVNMVVADPDDAKKTCEIPAPGAPKKRSYSQAFGDAMIKLASARPARVRHAGLAHTRMLPPEHRRARDVDKGLTTP